MNSYSSQRIVQTDDLDDLNHMNNVRYLEWVQDISRDHWASLSEELGIQSYLWVVRSHRMTYRIPALVGDALRVETFIKGFRGPLSTRIVNFRKEETGELIATCQTEWCLLDKESGKPVRVPVEVQRILDQS